MGRWKKYRRLCSARSSIWAPTEWQSLLCLWRLWRLWHHAETLGVRGGQRNLETIQSKIQPSSGEDTGQESWRVIYALLWTTLQVNRKELENSFLLTPSPMFPHSSWCSGGCFLLYFAWSRECTCSFDLDVSHVSTLLFVLDTGEAVPALLSHWLLIFSLWHGQSKFQCGRERARWTFPSPAVLMCVVYSVVTYLPCSALILS